MIDKGIDRRLVEKIAVLEDVGKGIGLSVPNQCGVADTVTHPVCDVVPSVMNSICSTKLERVDSSFAVISLVFQVRVNFDSGAKTLRCPFEEIHASKRQVFQYRSHYLMRESFKTA